MSDAPPVAVLTLLAYAIDEIRETRDLLRVSLAGLARRRGWRHLFGWVVGTRDVLTAGLAVQYLADNLARARDHWRAELGYLADLCAAADTSPLLRRLADDLEHAGVDHIMAKLGDDAVPRDRPRAAAHLEDTLRRMSECERILTEARNALMLQRMGDTY